MKIQLTILLFIVQTILFFPISAQDETPLPEFQLEKAEMEAHLRFLASDELMGRRTGSTGNNIAAAYLAANLKAYGLKTLPGLDSYYQRIPFKKKSPPKSANLKIGKTEYQLGKNLLILSGSAANIEAKAVFAGHGWVDEESGEDDYKDLNVKGKIVFVLPGPPNANNPFQIFKAMSKKQEWAKERGAVALVELFRLKFPWGFFKSYFNKDRLEMQMGSDESNDGEIIYGWIKEENEEDMGVIAKGKKMSVSLNSSGILSEMTHSNNVAGLIEGTDPDLKNEYILMSAHYDHVGAGKDGGGRFTPQDSIFNGARDNAMGTVAMLAAAKALSMHPPKRSIIYLAVTGEEMGMLGSSYYAENPIIPLEQTVYNFNSDGAGYDDINAVSVVGYGRTGTDDDLNAGAKAFGLKVIQNPAPEQGLFDRSDNVSFAQKGVPALNFSPGTTGFTKEIEKYYHQTNDEADSIDFDYLLKFCQVFAHSTRLIANKMEAPFWKKGDKYEEAGKALYKK